MFISKKLECTFSRMSDAAKLSRCDIEYNDTRVPYPMVPVRERQFLLDSLESNQTYRLRVLCMEAKTEATDIPLRYFANWC